MDKQKSENPMSRLMGLAGEQKKKYIAAIILAVLGVAAGIVPYFAVARMLIALMDGGHELSFYAMCCLIAAAGYLLKVVFSIWSTSVSHTATFEVLKEIRKKLLSKLSRLPMGVILDIPSGRLKNTIVDRVEGLETTLAHMIPEISANMLIPVILLIYLFTLDWRMALITLITLPLGMCFVMINALVTGSTDKSVSLAAFGVMVLSIAGKIVTQYISQLQRTHAGYFMVADKRICIGDKLKVVPMGYFNQNSLGNITAVATTILSDVENAAPVVLVTSLGGFLNSFVFSLAIFIFDWRIGLIVFAGMLLFLWVVSLMEKKSRQDVPKRQAAQAVLVETVLETIQGMGVVKAFNLDFNKGKKVDNAIDESCCKNMILEKAMNPYVAVQQIILYLFSVLVIFASICFYLGGSLSLVYCLMMMVASFMVYEQFKIAGSSMANLRITENSINRANEIDDVPVMDESGRDITLKTHDICFDNVTFSYEKRPVLKSVSLTIPDKSLTAIVGPSGSGKTTLCNLIARWDVNGGSVSVGGHDVKEYTFESLLSNISMVFQSVYLFNDTIENNIKFGKPDATHKEVVEAARKACCDDFISALPDGYDTIIGEGGASLSGGEKQRISIARAMLKDAPIVIFDEATANVDPENEDRLQAAIEALTKDKTLIMIAHRLKTVQNADQILVLDQGRIVQKGTHAELMKESGIYADFIGLRKQAIGWKL